MTERSLYCCYIRPSINFYSLDINLSKQYALMRQGQGFLRYGYGAGFKRGA